MNRLQKKCLFASVGFHALLALILIVGPAFLARKEPPFNLPQLSVIPTRTVDALLSGGGNPNAKPPPPAPTPAPQVVTPQPQPQPVDPPRIVQPQPEPRPAPPKLEPKPKPEPPPERPPEKPGNDPTAAPASKKPAIKVSTDIVKRSPREPTPAKPKNVPDTRSTAQTEALDAAVQRQIRSQFRNSFQGAVQTLNDTLSSGTTIDIPGPGGEAFANYGQVVIAIYKQNWIQPMGIKGYHVVKTTVVIGRDGRVRSHSIVSRSGNPAVDRSVADVLERVKFVRPFPSEAKDESRTFNISFELNSETDTG